jgi:hypothetical protein
VAREVPPAAGSDQAHLSDKSAIHPARKTLWFLVRLAIAGLLLAYLVKSGLIDLRALSKPFTAWQVALGAIALVLFDVALMAWRLSLLFQPRGMRLSWRASMKLTLVGFFFAAFLPGSAGGDLAKLFYTARGNRDRVFEIVAVTLFDRAIGLFSLLLMPLMLALFAPHFVRAVPALRTLFGLALVLAGGLVAAFLFCLYCGTLVKRLAGRLFWFLPSKALLQGLDTIADYRYHAGTVVAALALSLIANFSLVIVMLLGVRVLNPDGFNLRMAIIIPFGFIANSIPLTPGGLGLGETVFNGLFAIAGFSGGAEALVCWRVWTGLVRMLGLGFYLRGIDRCIFDGDARPEAHKAPETLTSRPPIGSIDV